MPSFRAKNTKLSLLSISREAFHEALPTCRLLPPKGDNTEAADLFRIILIRAINLSLDHVFSSEVTQKVENRREISEFYFLVTNLISYGCGVSVTPCMGFEVR